MTKRGTALLDIFFLSVVAMFLIIAASSFNYYARLVPLIIGIPCFFLGLIKLGQTLHGAPEGPLAGNKDAAATPSQNIPSLAQGSHRELKAISWVLGTGLAIYLFGFTAAIHGFLIIFIRWGIRESWKTTLITTAIIFLLYYGIFVKLVYVGFWQGLMYQLIFG